MQKSKAKTVAAIDLGSNSLRMAIAQLNPDGKTVILEELWKPTHVGRDTFAYGRIQVDSIHHTCDTLRGFVKLMQDYKVKHYRAVSTSGIREAENRDYVLEQIRLRTGLNVEVINNAQERFLMYKAIRDRLPDDRHVLNKETLILDIGSGGVEVSAYTEGTLMFTEYLKVGTLRLRELLSDLERLTLDFPSVMEEFIESRIHYLTPRIRKMNIKNFIGLGGELITISRLCFNEDLEADKKYIKKEVLEKLYSKVHAMTAEQIVQEYGLQRNQAEVLLPSIIIFYQFLQMTGAKGIYAPMVSLRHGMLADMADDFFNTARKTESLNDIISSIWYIGQKYCIDEIHSAYVEKLANSIFDQTVKVHRMGEREQFYLRIASILHDVGKHVNLNQHALHSYNIIRFQDIMGFSNRELMIVANIARYHSEENPELSDENYFVMGDEDRIMVSKLAAMLKLAEALDISHKQKIESISIRSCGKELHFIVKASEEILLEETNFAENAVFFEEVMGNKPVIKRKG